MDLFKTRWASSLLVRSVMLRPRPRRGCNDAPVRTGSFDGATIGLAWELRSRSRYISISDAVLLGAAPAGAGTGALTAGAGVGALGAGAGAGTDGMMEGGDLSRGEGDDGRPRMPLNAGEMLRGASGGCTGLRRVGGCSMAS